MRKIILRTFSILTRAKSPIDGSANVSATLKRRSPLLKQGAPTGLPREKTWVFPQAVKPGPTDSEFFDKL
jgi:hypothetical protein